MKARFLVALAALTVTQAAQAQEAAVSTAGPTPAPAPGAGLGNPDGFASPNGQLGAGLSISRTEGGRAFGELGFYTTGDSESEGGFEASYRLWALSMIVGGGYKIAPDIEIDAMLPLAFINFSTEFTGPPPFEDQSDSETEVAVGNLHVGASYMRSQGPLRWKLGGAAEYGIWTIDPSTEFALTLGFNSLMRGGQDPGLWAYETLSLVTPGRVEYGDQVVATGDGQLGMHIPTDGRDVELTVQINPGVGYYATPTVLFGARLPFLWVPTASGSSATYLALEPYGRFDFGQAFFNARFTLNIDEPLGFSFDEGKVWGLHLGGGGTF